MWTKIITLLLLIMMTSISYAQETGVQYPAFASTENGSLHLVDTSGQDREIIGAANIRYPIWNADGSKLAFLVVDPDFQVSLAYADSASGEVTFLQTPDLDTGFNLNWTRDGRILFATYNPQSDPAGAGYFVDIHALTPVPQAVSEVLGTVPHGVGCGGGSNLPADWVYWDETASLGGFFTTLADTPYGIIYNLACGGAGFGLLNLQTGESTIIAENFSKLIVSPDGSRVAGIEYNYPDRAASRLRIYNLTDQSWTEVSTVAEPDQIAWSYDGSGLYYSIRTPAGNLITALTDEQHANLNEQFGYEVEELPNYQVTLHYVDLATDSSTQIYSADAYAIGRLIATQDALFFSQIPNLNEWLLALVNGEISYQDSDAGKATYFEPALLRLAPAESPEAAFVGWFSQFTPLVVR